jgi:NAD+ synthase
VKALEIHAPLVERMLVQFLREEIASAGFSKAVLGISGGVDSALVAALCAKAFGPQNVLGVMMPYRTSNPDSEGHARLLADTLGIATKKVEITAMADGYLAAHKVEDRMRRGNVMARCRMIVLYDLSVEFKGLVIGTSNKTEILLGYSTQWGDSASAVNPIGDLYKAQIYQLSRHLGVPAPILDKAPSADLFEGQTDEGELGFSYADADRLLFHMVDERLNEDELVARGFDVAFVRRVAHRIAATQFKRVMPLIAKLSQRTVNQDFRYLRDWGR